MGWKDTGKSPMELMGLDKDTKPEQVKAMLEAGTKAVADVAALKTEMQTNFNGLTEVLRGVNDKLAEGFNREPAGEPELTDEQKAARATAAAAAADPVNRLTTMTLQTQAMVVERDVLGSLPYYKFNGKDGALKAEIDKELATQPLAARTNPQFIKNVYDVVVGRHIDDIQQDTNKKEGKFYLESASNGGNSNFGSGPNTPRADDSLTEQELKMAKGFNMTPEQYKESKTKLVMVR